LKLFTVEDFNKVKWDLENITLIKDKNCMAYRFRFADHKRKPRFA